MPGKRFKIFNLSGFNKLQKENFYPQEINIERFKSNPVMLFMHQRGFTIGSWDNIEINNKGEIFADALITNKEIEEKVRNKEIRGASVAVQFSAEGETRRVDIMEASIVDVPRMSDALAQDNSKANVSDLRKIKNSFTENNISLNIPFAEGVNYIFTQQEDTMDEPQKKDEQTKSTNTSPPKSDNNAKPTLPIDTDSPSAGDEEKGKEQFAMPSDVQAGFDKQNSELKAKMNKLDAYTKYFEDKKNAEELKEAEQFFARCKSAGVARFRGTDKMPEEFVSLYTNPQYKVELENELKGMEKQEEYTTPVIFDKYVKEHVAINGDFTMSMKEQEVQLTKRATQRRDRSRQFFKKFKDRLEYMSELEQDQAYQSYVGDQFLELDLKKFKEEFLDVRGEKQGSWSVSEMYLPEQLKEISDKQESYLNSQRVKEQQTLNK